MESDALIAVYANRTLDWAQLNGMTLSSDDIAILRAAGAVSSFFDDPGRTKQFYEANAKLTTLVGATRLGDIRSLQDRLARLRPAVNDASRLLAFASANGKPIEDSIVQPIVAASDAVSSGAATAAIEEAFLKAYEGLTRTLDGITAETLQASETRFPKLGELFSGGWRNWQTILARMTFGRFALSVPIIYPLAQAAARHV